MGKSLYVKRLAQKLQRQHHPNSTHVIVPIHGPVVNADTVMTSLCKCTTRETSNAEIIHLDIASSVSTNVYASVIATYIFKENTYSTAHF